jgi:hypothetical protein
MLISYLNVKKRPKILYKRYLTTIIYSHPSSPSICYRLWLIANW